VNLQGAHGILVNITAGLDLTLGEFEEVGQIIQDIAADNATVVVGTVIDPNMSDELRVTVVATGLAGVNAAFQDTSLKVIETAVKKPAAIDYRDLDRPAIQRRGGASTAAALASAAAVRELAPEPSELRGLDMLDIPAFLRRQAD
jgi:cell division protein FtsZ